ncbi:MAG TPA: glycosyltransferase family 39 protein [Patescibacteria group bacterium]
MRHLMQRLKLQSEKHKLISIALLIGLGRIVILILPLLIVGYQTHKPILLDSTWNRWDTPHYLYITQHWYGTSGDEANFIVFPPLYPAIVTFANLLIKNVFTSALLVSNFFFILGSLVFYLLVKKDYDEQTALKSLVLLNIFPTSYFFSIGYTESLFFFLLVSCFFFSQNKNWYESSLSGALTFLTRTMGLITLPTLFVSLLLEKINLKKKILLSVLITIPFIISISTYLAVNWLLFGKIFAFKEVLETHWYKHLDFPWVSIKNSLGFLKIPLTHDSLMLGLFEGGLAILCFALIPFIIKKLKVRDWVYYILSILFITSTSFLLSTPRYLLSIPPLFIFLALISKRKIVFIPLVLIFSCLLLYFSVLFVKGQWAF